jgi:putative PIN family toxin of toxin-antitoxin system
MDRSEGIHRLVLDTNVWLDWLIFADPAVGPIRQAMRDRRIEIVMDQHCEAELERVLAYPIRGSVAPVDMQARWMVEALGVVRWLRRDAEETAPSRLPRCRDPDDQKFLQLARDANADFLVTRDKALLEFARRRYQPLPFRVVTPVQFGEEHPATA